jgi:hypothetical protein
LPFVLLCPALAAAGCALATGLLDEMVEIVASVVVGNLLSRCDGNTQAITFEPRLHEAYATLGTAYFDRREFGKAIADYNAAISIDSDIPMYFSWRGNTRYMMARLSERDRQLQPRDRD